MKNELVVNRCDLVEFYKVMDNEQKFETFCYAVIQNNKEMCQILLDSGFDVNFHTFEESAFATRGHKETVLTALSPTDKLTLDMAKWLIEYGADVNIHNICEEHTPIYLACMSNNYELVTFYLENGAKVTKDLIARVTRTNVKIGILNELLKATDNYINNISSKDIFGNCYLRSSDYIKEDETFEKLKLLLKFGFQPDVNKMYSYLKVLIMNRKLEAVKYLFENYSELIDINGIYDYSDTSIYLYDIAVENNDVDMQRLLEKFGGHASTTEEKVKRITTLLKSKSNDKDKSEKLLSKLAEILET